MSTCGYGSTAPYGQQVYKGECEFVVKAVDFLIQQYANSYINSSTSSFIKTIASTTTDDNITVGEISALGLIQQFDKGYFNG